MITPLDIQNKEFPRGVRGYKEDEVDGFLDLLTLDLEKIIKENAALKERVKSLALELERFRTTEATVYDTLEVAKSLMNDISSSAEKRASMVMKNAELDAQLIVREAKESVDKLDDEYAAIKIRLNIFKTRFKTLLESELERFDTLSAEIFSEKDFEDLRSITDLKPMENVSVQKTATAEKATSSTIIMNSVKTGDGL
jgi:cell division initiation protein